MRTDRVLVISDPYLTASETSYSFYSSLSLIERLLRASANEALPDSACHCFESVTRALFHSSPSLDL